MKTVGALLVNPYNPISSVADTRNWFDCDLLVGASTCSGRALTTNGDDIAQDNEIGASNNSRFGLAPDRRADSNLQREYDWDYTVGVQHQLFPRVSVTAAWYYLRSYDVPVTKNAAIGLNDYTSFQAANPLNNGETITVFNLNRAKQGVLDTVDTTSSINRRFYSGYELSSQARLPNGGVIFGGWSIERTLLVTCDTSDPNQLRFCDQTGETYQELGAVPSLPYRHEFKVAVSSPLPWHLNAGLSLISYPGVVTTTANGITTFGSLGVNWVVPPALFPGGRTQSVTVPLIAPGTSYPPRWNQLDVNIKRRFRVGHYEIEPGVDVFNLLNSSVVLTQQQAFGAGRALVGPVVAVAVFALMLAGYTTLPESLLRIGGATASLIALAPRLPIQALQSALYLATAVCVTLWLFRALDSVARWRTLSASAAVAGASVPAVMLVSIGGMRFHEVVGRGQLCR